MINVQIKKIQMQINYKEAFLGLILVVIGIVAPCFINIENFKIYHLIESSIAQKDKSLLVIASFKLVMLNTIRSLPHYLGTFIIAESIKLILNGRRISLVKNIFLIVIIPAVYMIINIIHHIRYDFGIPALIVILLILFLEKLDFSTISIFKKSVIVTLLLIGMQWLDVIPILSNFGFGMGETSQDIKQVAKFIDSEYILTLSALIFLIIFTVNAILIAKIISDQHKLIVAGELNKHVENELAEAKFKALEARNFMELRNLVHDLKTPLTSMQALVSMVELMEENKKCKDYLKRIEISIDKLSEMISEILYEDKRNVISTDKLFNFIFAQISPLPYASMITYKNAVPKAFINVNKIRISRAIINAMENSYNAIGKKDGNIHINVQNEQGKIYIKIQDNGCGIKEEVIEKMWDEGFSTRNSTGLGLDFIKRIIESHEGRVYISSIPSEGTCLTIVLKEVEFNG